MSVAAPLDFDYAAAAHQGSRIRVATKFTRIARDHFADKGVHVDIIKLYGSMELAPLTGLADAIVDLVASGNTLKANALVEVEEIMQISARLVVNKAALKLDREPIRALIDSLATAVAPTETAPCSAWRCARSGSTASTPGFDAALAALLAYSAETDHAIEAERRRDPRRRPRARRRRGARVHAPLRRRSTPASVAALEVGPAELAAALAALPAAQRGALETAAGAHPRLPRAPARRRGRSWSHRDGDGSLLGQKVTPLERVGIYVPGGKAAYPSSVLMNAMPAKVAGVGEIVMVAADAAAASATRCVLAAAAPRRRRPRVHDRRRAGDRRARLRHGDDPRRAQDHRARQRLRRERQAARLRHGRHRHDRRAERDPRPRRRHDAARLGRDGPVQPGRARRARAEHPALSRRRLPRSRARRDRAAAAGAAAPRHHPRLARRPRRADPDALDGRGVRDQRTGSRPSTSRSARASRSAGSRC